MFGPAYTKIHSAWKRDMSKPGNPVIPGEWAQPEFEYLQEAPWTWTEKINGMNLRLYWDGEKVTLGGRTDSAQIPAALVQAITDLGLLDPAPWARKWPVQGELEHQFPEGGVTIYGEGYGPRIQKGGGLYRDDPGFIVFDVRVGNWWLQRHSVLEVAEGFGLDVVPVVGTFSPWLAWDWMYETARNSWSLISYTSPWAGRGVIPEGFVGTPEVPLFDRKGQRIIMKMKVRDAAVFQRRPKESK